jgi:hypothetical protein
MKDFTRVCKIEPQAEGAWLKQTSVKSNFQHVLYTIFFRRSQKNKKNANIRHPFLVTSRQTRLALRQAKTYHYRKSSLL